MTHENSFQLKSEINGITVSTVKIGKIYETMAYDQFGNELKVMHTNYKTEARHNHLICVSFFAIKRNCIRAI
jgi:hypothetical protein